MNRPMAAVATAGMLLLAECGSDPQPTESATTSGDTSTTSSYQNVKVGETIEGEVVTFAVSDVRDITEAMSFDGYQDDGTWAAMVEICATGDLGEPISPMLHFVLIDDEGGMYQPSGESGGNLPTPQLDPGTLSLQEGKCRKGNLFFDAPAGASITEVEAVEGDGESVGAWKL